MGREESGLTSRLEEVGMEAEGGWGEVLSKLRKDRTSLESGPFSSQMAIYIPARPSRWSESVPAHFPAGALREQWAIDIVAEPALLPCSHCTHTGPYSIDFWRSLTCGLKIKYRRSEATTILVSTLPLNMLWGCEPLLP